jgi:hypothetical protein
VIYYIPHLETHRFSGEMYALSNGLQIQSVIICLLVLVEWTQSGENVTASALHKKRSVNERRRSLGTGEAFTNCTCPKDSPIDTTREYCGYEILEKTGPSNPCENHTVYRCMDPDPWKAIDHIPCAHYGKRNSDKVRQKCGLDLAPRHTYLRHCVV